MAGWRQTSRQRQAHRQADTGGQAVEHRRANSQTSKQTYWQTFTHAHGDVDKHKRNVLEHTQPQGSGLAAWGKDQYRYIESSSTRTTAQLSLENTEVHVFNITWCKAGAGKQAD